MVHERLLAAIGGMCRAAVASESGRIVGRSVGRLLSAREVCLLNPDWGLLQSGGDKTPDGGGWSATARQRSSLRKPAISWRLNSKRGRT
jgi:hypothetical protein